MKCFSYSIAQNKGNPKGLQCAIRCIVPHAFGEHEHCDITWCRFKQDPVSYKHHDLPHGKDLFGVNLRNSLENLLNEYSTDNVVEKLAPLTNSQRNEALNNVVGSKNPKIRFYGGSDSNDFRVACGVAQTNLRYQYIDRTLEALNIEPGFFCSKFNEKMTKKVIQEKTRKSTVKFKRRRSQIHSSNCSQTARKEAAEGTTYKSGVGINLDFNSVTDTSATMQASQFKEIESFVSEYTPRPKAQKVKFDKDGYYNFLVFDTETNSTGKGAEICQLAVTDKSGLHTFSTYILPKHNIDFYASKVNKLKILSLNGERKLLKNNELVHTLPFHEAISQLQSYVSESINRAKSSTN